ncbi:ANK [Seminavis robusta]|uniref:ANK n=1 Tax=Seminavis robusta TaxID=568900 RepID=A0A9N8EDZ0_9STRA|nr:ANK [Seminavis robusta]|eukprot:Sro1038_g234240.1 ANK (398) ;mRNA; r:2818-4011
MMSSSRDQRRQALMHLRSSETSSNSSAMDESTASSLSYSKSKRASLLSDGTETTAYSEDASFSYSSSMHRGRGDIDNDNDNDGAGSEYSEALSDLDDLDDLEVELLDFDKRHRCRGVTAMRASTGSRPRPRPRKVKNRRASAPIVSAAVRALASNAQPRNASMPMVSSAILQERMDKAAQNSYFQSPDAHVQPDQAAGGPKSPEEYLTQDLLQGIAITALQEEHFDPVTDERIEAHKMAVSSAIRAADLDRLQELLQDGISLGGCNPQGESMMHLACRLNNADVVKFLINEAKVSILVQDDAGRTPLHDAAWTTKPNFELVQLIVEEAPELLFVKDKRSFSALRYIPKAAWKQWRSFFDEHQDQIRRLVTNISVHKAHRKIDDAQERMKKLMEKMAL